VRWLFAPFYFKKLPMNPDFFWPSFFFAGDVSKKKRVKKKEPLSRLSFAGWAV